MDSLKKRLATIKTDLNGCCDPTRAVNILAEERYVYQLLLNAHETSACERRLKDLRRERDEIEADRKATILRQKQLEPAQQTE
jgi:hypothetical protein